MAEKLINTRIALRIDTLANWSKTDVEGKGAKLVLKRGEIGLCEIPSGNAAAQTAPTVLFKVGDGTTTFGELKWASALAADVYSWAKASDVVLDGEIIKFVGTDKTIDLSKFALNSELTTAITNLEAKDAALGKRIDDVIAAAYDDTEVRGLITKEVSDREAADLVLEGKIEDAQEAADNAQKEVDALEGVVSSLSANVDAEVARVEGLITKEVSDRKTAISDINTLIGSVVEGKDVVTMISDAKTAVEGKVTALENGQVKTNKEEIEAIKGDYLKASDKSGLEAKITANTTKIGTDIAAAKAELKGVSGDNSTAETIYGAKKYADEKAGNVQSSLESHLSAYNTKVGELENADSALDGKITTEKTAREAAIARVEGLVSTEKSRAEGIEAGLRADITNIQNNIASGLHFCGIKESTSEITNPQSGDIVIVGNQEYIYDGSDWEEFGNAEAHATRDELTSGLSLKVDKTTYDAKIAALEDEDADIRADFATADSNLKSELEGKINGKVAQDDFNNLSNTVSGLSSSKLDKSVYDVHIEAYTGKVSSLEAKDASQDEKISAIETSLAAGGTINDLIVAAQNQANKGVNDAATVQSNLNTLSEQIGVISGDKTLVDQLVAVKTIAEAAAVQSVVDASIAAINTEVAKKATIVALETAEGRITVLEGEMDAVEGRATTLEGKVSTLEARYTDAKVDELIAAAVNGEKTRAEAAESALDTRIKVYEDKFGTKDDILVFNCGDSVTNI